MGSPALNCILFGFFVSIIGLYEMEMEIQCGLELFLLGFIRIDGFDLVSLGPIKSY